MFATTKKPTATVFEHARAANCSEVQRLLGEHGEQCFTESHLLLYTVAHHCDDPTFLCALAHVPDGYFDTKMGKKEIRWISEFCSTERAMMLPRVHLKGARFQGRTNTVRRATPPSPPPKHAKLMQWNAVSTLVPGTYLLISPDGPFSIETMGEAVIAEWVDSDAAGVLKLKIPGAHCFDANGNDYYRATPFSVCDIAGLRGGARPTHLWVGLVSGAPRIETNTALARKAWEILESAETEAARLAEITSDAPAHTAAVRIMQELVDSIRAIYCRARGFSNSTATRPAPFLSRRRLKLPG